MIELSSSELWADLVDSPYDILLIAAPNFEIRSMSTMLEIDTDESSIPRRVFVGLLTFQASSGRIEPLEYLKMQNIKDAEEILRRHGHWFLRKTIPYPDPGRYSWLETRELLHDMFRQLGSRFHLVIDISAIPTRVLCDILEVIEEASTKQGGEMVRSVCLAYSWPESYPRPRYPTTSGEPFLLRSQRSVVAGSSGVPQVNLAITLGSQGFQAQHLVEALPDNKKVSVYAFLNQTNILYSMEVFRANTELFYNVNAAHLYLSIPSGHEKIMDWANGIELVEGGLNLIAPFGPRPTAVSAWCAVQLLRDRFLEECGEIDRNKCDIVRYRTHHYATPYSLGRGPVSYYLLQLRMEAPNADQAALESMSNY